MQPKRGRETGSDIQEKKNQEQSLILNTVLDVTVEREKNTSLLFLMVLCIILLTSK